MIDSSSKELKKFDIESHAATILIYGAITPLPAKII